MNVLKLEKIALAYAELSKDPSTKIGCVIFDDEGSVLSEGFNGFPRGVHDAPERLNDRPTKYKYVVHGEANAIAQAARKGVSLKNGNLLVTKLYPCSSCAGLIIQAGIKAVYVPKDTANDRWNESSEIALTMFEEAGVNVIPYDPS